MEHASSNERKPLDSQRADTFEEICRRLALLQVQAESAGQYLAKQKYLTSAQCKHATQFLSALDDPISDLCVLLKQKPLPLTIDFQLHILDWTLREIKEEKRKIQSYINGSYMLKEVVYAINAISEKIKQIIDTLIRGTLAVFPEKLPSDFSQVEKDFRPEQADCSIEEKRRNGSSEYDPALGIQRLYALFQERSELPPVELETLEARLNRNLQDRSQLGISQANNAEWALIIQSLAHIASRLNVKFNDLCYA